MKTKLAPITLTIIVLTDLALLTLATSQVLAERS